MTLDSRITLEILEEEVILACRSSVKADQGKYSCTLKNEKGSDTAKIDVIVVSAPAAPEGPLVADDITPESCKLAWAPPKVRKVTVFTPALLKITITFLKHQNTH